MGKLNLRQLDKYLEQDPLKEKFKKRKKFKEEEPKPKQRKTKRS